MSDARPPGPPEEDDRVVAAPGAPPAACKGVIPRVAAVFLGSQFTAVHFLCYNLIGAGTGFAGGVAIGELDPRRA
jgi:hypothetical protein